MAIEDVLDVHPTLTSLRSSAHQAAPGLAVVLTSGATTVEAVHRGMANLEDASQIGPETRFHVASLAKQFTALAVLELRDRGILELDDALSKHLPGFAVEGPAITIRQLLAHTSGLKDQWALMELAGWRGNDEIDTSDVCQIIDQQVSTQFVPGSRYMYSNTGYTLLGRIVAGASGIPFSQYVDENIFTALGMENTLVANDSSAPIVGRAQAYRAEATTTGNNYRKFSPNLYVEGPTSLFTTSADYAKWLTAQRADSPWRHHFDEMRQPQVYTGGGRISYGLGLFADESEYGSMTFHAGEDFGFTSFSAFFPEHDVGVAILTNSSLGSLRALATDIAEQGFGRRLWTFDDAPWRLENMTASADPAPDPERYHGVYESPVGEIRRVVEKDGSLAVVWGGLQRLSFLGDNVFTTPAGERYHFTAAGQGVGSFVQVSTHGRNKWTRVDVPGDDQIAGPDLSGIYFSDETQAMIEVIGTYDEGFSVALPKQGFVPADRITTKLYLLGPWWFRVADAAGHRLRVSSPWCLDVEYKKVLPNR